MIEELKEEYLSDLNPDEIPDDELSGAEEEVKEK